MKLTPQLIELLEAICDDPRPPRPGATGRLNLALGRSVQQRIHTSRMEVPMTRITSRQTALVTLALATVLCLNFT